MTTKQTTLADLMNTAVTQGNPIDALRTFLDKESSYEKAKQIAKMVTVYRPPTVRLT